MNLPKIRGFTLIEIITVLAIIIILISLLSPALRRAREQANEQKARAMIASLEVAINMYYTDLGNYPTDVINTNIFNSLLGSKLTVGTANYGPYMDFKSNEVSVNAVLDPWGIDYRYTQPSLTQDTIHIWSCGPDTNDGSLDDIKNW